MLNEALLQPLRDLISAHITIMFDLLQAEGFGNPERLFPEGHQDWINQEIDPYQQYNNALSTLFALLKDENASEKLDLHFLDSFAPGYKKELYALLKETANRLPPTKGVQLLQQASDLNTPLGQIFHYQRGLYETDLKSGCLAKISTLQARLERRVMAEKSFEQLFTQGQTPLSDEKTRQHAAYKTELYDLILKKVESLSSSDGIDFLRQILKPTQPLYSVLRFQRGLFSTSDSTGLIGRLNRKLTALNRANENNTPVTNLNPFSLLWQRNTTLLATEERGSDLELRTTQTSLNRLD